MHQPTMQKGRRRKTCASLQARDVENMVNLNVKVGPENAGYEQYWLRGTANVTGND